MKIHVGQVPSAKQRENIMVPGLLDRPELAANIFSRCDARRIFYGPCVGLREREFHKNSSIHNNENFRNLKSLSQCSVYFLLLCLREIIISICYLKRDSFMIKIP